MAGSKSGGEKAALTTKQKYGEDFHKKAGSKSWSNPNRSHKTGFALLSEEARKEAGRRGGKKTKAEYKIGVDFAYKDNKEDYELGGRKVGDKFKINGIEYEVALVEELPKDYTTPEAEETSPGVS